MHLTLCLTATAACSYWGGTVGFMPARVQRLNNGQQRYPVRGVGELNHDTFSLGKVRTTVCMYAGAQGPCWAVASTAHLSCCMLCERGPLRDPAEFACCGPVNNPTLACCIPQVLLRLLESLRGPGLEPASPRCDEWPCHC